MNDVQTNQLNRAQKDAQFLNEHSAQLEATPDITEVLLPELNSGIEKTFEDDSLASQDNTGHADSKKEIREALEESVYHVASGLTSYADDKNDFVSQNMVEVSVSTIQNFRDSRLVEFSQHVLDKASNETVAAELAERHNVSAADITELGTNLENFSGVKSSPLTKRGESVAYGKQVDRDLKAVNETLEKIRRKMRTYRKSNRLLFDMWTAVDTIDDFGHGGERGTQSGSTSAGGTN